MKSKIKNQKSKIKNQKSKIYFLILFTALLLGFSLQSCTKEVKPEEEDIPKNWTNPGGQQNPGVTEDMTVLGGQRPNPYNIDTMKHASRIVRGSDAEIQTNFYYIRFEPADLDELQILDSDTTLFLSDTPLDYDFIQEGSYYHDPNITNEHPTYYYCVVGINQNLPQVNHSILDYLYIPDIDNESDIECQALDLCNIPYTSGSSKGMFRTEPNGRITVTEGGANVGVNHVKVIAYNWFRFRSTYTDANGYFSFNTKFRKARIKLKFISDKANMRIARDLNVYRMLTTYKTKIKNDNDYVFVNNELSNINFNFDYYSDITTKGAENWYCAIVWNSLYETHKYAAQIGINSPPNHLNIYLTSYTPDGAAPMLHKMGQSGYTVNMLAAKLESISTLFILTEFAAPSLINSVSAVLQKETPDIIYGMRSVSNFRDFEGLYIFHELGHSIHYLKAGNYYWENEIDYIIQNDGYGDKSTQNSGICALSESWANYFGFYLKMLKYDNAQHTIAQDIENTISIDASWFPVGIYWDLFDDENTLSGFINENPNIHDDVYGISIIDSYDNLSGCNNIIDYKNKLKQNYQNQYSDIERLFKSYGY